MLGRLARDTAVYGTAHLISRSTYLLVVPVLTSLLVPAEVGAVELLLVAGSILAIIASAEITQGLARYVPGAATAADRRQLASTAAWFVSATYLGVLVLTWLLAEGVSEVFFGVPSHADAVRASVLASGAGALFLVISSQLRWEMRPVAYAVVSILHAALSLGGLWVALAVWDLGVPGVFMSQAAAGALAGLVALWMARPSFGVTVDPPALRRLLAFSLPLVPSSIGVLVALYVDRVAVNVLMSTADVGVFGVAARIASIVSLVTSGVALALTPMIYGMFDQPGAREELARVFLAVVAAALGLLAVLTLFSGELVQLVAGDAYVGAGMIVPLLAPALLLNGLVVFAPGPAIAGRTGIIATVNIAVAVTNVVLNLALIPLLGLAGAATATLLSALCGFTAMFVASQRLYRVPHRWGSLAVLAAVAAVLVVVGLAAGSLTAGPAAIGVRIAAASVLGVSLAAVAIRQLTAGTEAAT